MFKSRARFLTFFSTFLVVLGWIVFAVPVRAADYDLSIRASDIEFSKSTIIVKDKVRIYAVVRNIGNNDMSGYITFFRGTIIVANPQQIQVRPGKTIDVYADLIVPENPFSIQVKIQGTDPKDQNSENDIATTVTIYPDRDTDNDGTVDRLDSDDDNDGLSDADETRIGTDHLRIDTDGDGYNDKVDIFPLDAKEAIDTDRDGLGDNTDPDDDNDGLSDEQEKTKGTDPKRQDTDGDGVIDSRDFYPLDPKRSVEEKAKHRDIFTPVKAAVSAVKTAVTNPEDVTSKADLEAILTDLAESATATVEAEPIVEYASDLATQPSEEKPQANFFNQNHVILSSAAILILVLLIFGILFFIKRRSGTGKIQQAKTFIKERAVDRLQKIRPQAQPIQHQAKSSSHILDLKDVARRKQL